MIILGLDVSSACTGWAIIEDETLIAFGEIQLSAFKKKKEPLKWMKILYNEIAVICDKYNPQKVFIEDTFVRNALTIKTLARARGVAEIACLNSGITFIAVRTASHIRKTVLGEGNLKSEQICSILEDRYSQPIKTKGLDAADAILVALCGSKEN
jgi:crossover junction endodeoxyribonuclease RuvC